MPLPSLSPKRGRGKTRGRVSDDALLAIGRVVHDPLVAQPREIDRLVATLDVELGKGPSDGRGMHEAVPREAAGDVEVVEPAGPVTEDHVAVELALVVEPRPLAAEPELVERENAARAGGPHHLLEVARIDLEVEAARLVGPDQPDRVALSFGPDDQSIRVLDEGHRRQLARQLDVVLEAA